MACTPCWQQRQVLMSAMRQGNPWMIARAVRGGVLIATDKYMYSRTGVARRVGLRRDTVDPGKARLRADGA